MSAWAQVVWLHPAWLLLLSAVPAALAWRHRAGRPARAFAPGFAGLPSTWRTRLALLPTILLGLSLALAMVALARPVERQPLPRVHEGIDVMLVVDVSSSMSALDLDPDRTRLEVAVEAATAFVAARPDDRIGLVRFARFPELRCPPTLDHEVLATLLAEQRPVDEDGAEDATGIGAAIALAAQVLDGSASRSRVVVLLTDGEENVASTFAPREIAPLHAAQLCETLGVRVHAITAGSGRLAADGSWEAVDTAEVDALAQRSGGRSWTVRDAGALRSVYADIDALETASAEEPRFRLRERYRTPLAAALILAALAILLATAPLRVRPMRPMRLRGALAVLAFAAGGYAYWGPLGDPVPTRVDLEGAELVVCLDLSRSMLASDLTPHRLARAQQDLRRLTEHAVGDRFALVLFAGEAQLRVPRTVDGESLAMLAERADPSDLSLGGTDLGAALDAARAAVDEPHGATVLLLSDGEDHGGVGLDAARRLGSEGILVHTVGYGTARGSRIAVPVAGREDFVRDADGVPVLSALDPDGLRRIADATGGSYLDAVGTEDVLVALYERYVLPAAREGRAAALEETREPLFQRPLAAAVLFGLLAFGLVLRRRR